MTDKCDHSIYRQGGYLTADNALKAIGSKKSDICWMSAIIQTCETCGADISHARAVKVQTVDDIMRRELGECYEYRR